MHFSNGHIQKQTFPELGQGEAELPHRAPFRFTKGRHITLSTPRKAKRRAQAIEHHQAATCKVIGARSRLDVDQSVHDGLEFGARPEERDVRVGLDLFGQLGVGIDHLAKQNGGAAEVTSPQAIALFL